MKIHMRKLASAVLTVALAFAALTGRAHDDEHHDELAPPLILGVLDFPNSGAAEAQESFARGVMLLHSFEFDDARAAFLEAQAADPGFAMAIWGEAMSLNHPLWEQQDRDGALQVLGKLPPAGERRTTAREEGFLDAVFTLYGDGSKHERDVAYREAMRRMYEAYPDDLEAASFYALSILGSVYERDFRTYMLAASIAEDVFARQPQHPGAAHYLIHSYDDPIHAPLGLRAARAYSKIAPAASHAQHMVSHIYTSLGMWDEVIEANRTAVRVSEQSLQRAGRDTAMRSKHALHWLQYALLQQGRFDESRDTLMIMKADVAALPDSGNRRHNAMMRATCVVEDPLSPPVLEVTDRGGLPLDLSATDIFATAFTDIARGRLDAARAELRQLNALTGTTAVVGVDEGLHESDSATSADGYLIATIIARQIDALLRWRAGDRDQAVAIMESAAADENGRALYYGPPHVPKPSSELLGEMYLVLGRFDEAAAQFDAALEHNTARSLSLLGLARAQDALGRPEAALTWQRLDANWRGDKARLHSLEYRWL